MPDRDDLSVLRAENARLIALLESQGIEWRPPRPVVVVAREPEPSRYSTVEKVTLFRRLFRGRTDVYPVRWEGKTSGKSGYAPACANEWRAGVCEKPRIKCGECGNRSLIPLTDAVIYDHLAGEHTVGVYPLLEDDSCFFLAVDFDEAEWRDDARAFMQSCGALGVPAALEISRSGQGAHAWVYFAGRVSARDARRLGTAVAAEFRPPLAIASAVVAMFAVFHGHAHGRELPDGASAIAYSLGFVVATGMLHAAGIGLGVAHRRAADRLALRTAGGGIALAGCWFLWRALA